MIFHSQRDFFPTLVLASRAWLFGYLLHQLLLIGYGLWLTDNFSIQLSRSPFTFLGQGAFFGSSEQMTASALLIRPTASSNWGLCQVGIVSICS